MVVQDSKYGFINHEGKIVIQPQFIWADDFSHGLAPVYVCGRYASIDSSGTLFPFRVATEGHLVPKREGEKVGFVDANGQFKINPTFDQVLPFSQGFAAVRIGNKWGFVNAEGVQVIRPQFKAAFYFREGVAVAESHSGDVLIDTSGKVIASGFRFVHLVSNGRVPASRGRKEGYLDLQGRVVIPFIYEEVSEFSGGLAAVKKGGKWGYVARDGRVVIPFEFDKAGSFASGLAPVRTGDNTGFINESGKFSFYLPFKDAPGFWASDEDAFFIAGGDVSRFWTIDQKFGYVNTSGQVIWGPSLESPTHTPLYGWSEEEKANSCEGIPEAIKARVAGFPPP